MEFGQQIYKMREQVYTIYTDSYEDFIELEVKNNHQKIPW
jgi:hypothetical protein